MIQQCKMQIAKSNNISLQPIRAITTDEYIILLVVIFYFIYTAVITSSFEPNGCFFYMLKGIINILPNSKTKSVSL